MVERSDPLRNCTGFDWDDGNREKNWMLHQVTPEEAEDIFFHEPLVVGDDTPHSGSEKRFYSLGQTSRGRLLFAAFTVRRNLIRIISVRDMNRKERVVYGKHENQN